jgi:hypothetical protein
MQILPSEAMKSFSKAKHFIVPVAVTEIGDVYLDMAAAIWDRLDNSASAHQNPDPDLNPDLVSPAVRIHSVTAH